MGVGDKERAGKARESPKNGGWIPDPPGATSATAETKAKLRYSSVAALQNTGRESGETLMIRGQATGIEFTTSDGVRKQSPHRRGSPSWCGPHWPASGSSTQSEKLHHRHIIAAGGVGRIHDLRAHFIGSGHHRFAPPGVEEERIVRARIAAEAIAEDLVTHTGDFEHRHSDIVTVAGADTPTATHYSRRSSGLELPGPHDFSTPGIHARMLSNCGAYAKGGLDNTNWLISLRKRNAMSDENRTRPA
jgi:hypothetical protein